METEGHQADEEWTVCRCIGNYVCGVTSDSQWFLEVPSEKGMECKKKQQTDIHRAQHNNYGAYIFVLFIKCCT